MILTDLAGNKSSQFGSEPILHIITLIIIFIIIIILAYYVTKFIAKYQSNALNGKSNIKVVEAFRVGGNKYLAVVKIGDNYYAVGIGKEEINLIDKLDSNSFSNVTLEDATVKKIDFKEILSQVKNKSKKNEDTK